MRQIITIFLCLISILGYSQDKTYIKVHFLYGSKPLKKYKDTEKKMFGGILGGHVGIEGENNKVLNFSPVGKLHWFPKKDNKHSTYAVHSVNKFYEYSRSNPDKVKKTIIIIPVTAQQKHSFDSISTAYMKKTPYDYAFLGMRCGAATYEILGQLNILPNYSLRKTFIKIFYPKILRKRLLKQANNNGWTILKKEGSDKRKWEQD